MKKNSFISLITVFFTFLIGAAVSSCEDNKDDALSEELSIKVFSPTKIIEGQEVMITGNGLDKVTSVVFPDGVSTTNIKIITHNDIRVIAPAGISTKGGELTVQTENQSVTARIPVTVGNPAVATLAPGNKAGVGDELTITGTDMEFFEKAIFPGKEDDVTLNAVDFSRKSTALLKLKVPAGIKDGLAQIRLVTCAGKEVLLPKLNLIATVLGPFEGEWVWASGTVWGNGGYLIHKAPEWWKLPAGEDLDKVGLTPGEGMPDASMVFSGPSLTKKRSDGTEATGKYTVDMTKTKTDESGNVWVIGQLVTQDVNLLCGSWAEVSEEGVTTTQEVYIYDIIEFTENRLVLAYNQDDWAWATAFFWIFERR